MKEKVKTLVIVSLLSLVPTLLVWFPFFLRISEFWNIPLPQNGMAVVVANYDGPLYLVVAKTFYNIAAIKANFQFTLPVEYYAAHFPLFPALIRLFSYLLGYPYAMLLVTIFSSIFATYFFFKLAESYTNRVKAFWLTAIFTIFPARWLIVRSIGSPEPLFIGAIIASVYYFNQKKYLLAGIFGAVAQLTKSPGILLFVAYILAFTEPLIGQITAKINTNWVKNIKVASFYPILFIPFSLLIVFCIFKLRLNNFWAYFNSGDNIHLIFPPFQIFNYSAPWVGTFWLEEVIFVYLISLVGLTRLVKQKLGVVAWFTGVYLVSIFFVAHRDIIRYALPIVPFLIIAFADVINQKEFRYIIAFLVIPIYLFSLAFISQNVMPIANWAPFL